MKNLLLLLALIAGTYTTAHYLFTDTGYVLISFDGYVFESSLWSLLLLFLLAIVVFKLAALGIRFLIGGLGLIYPLSHHAKVRRSQRLANKGLIQFANGHWKQAQKLLALAGDLGSSPLMNYLIAARAASSNNDMEFCKECLRKADQAAPAAHMAIGITQAEIHLSQNQLEQALATLRSLRKKSPKHPYVLKLLKQAYVRLNDWQQLAQLLPDLRKRKVMSNDDLQQLEHSIYNELFEQAWVQGKNLKEIKDRVENANQIWASLSRNQQKSVKLAWRYANCLFRLGAEEEAENFIRRQLPVLYSNELISLYGRLKSSDSGRQLLAAEKLLAERPNDADLLLALGRICLRSQLWGKAREYLETSLRLKRSVEAYNELGQLLAERNEHQLSSEYFQKGLALAAES